MLKRSMNWILPAGRRWRMIGAVAAVAALALALPESTVQAEPANDREMLLKAAFIYNFAKFVEWPAAAFAAADAPLSVCVHGDDAFPVIAQAMNGKTVGSRALAVVNQHRAAPPICHITFIGADEPESSYVAHLKAPHTLTVSDRNRFASTGGMVGLVIVDNKIRFEVDLRMTRAAGLRIEAALLRLATEVIE